MGEVGQWAWYSRRAVEMEQYGMTLKTDGPYVHIWAVRVNDGILVNLLQFIC